MPTIHSRTLGRTGLEVSRIGLGTAALWTPEVIAKGLGIALLSSVLPYSLELSALRRLSARVFGILLSLEPSDLRQTFEALRNPPPPMVSEAGRSSRPPPPPIVDPSTPPQVPHARRNDGEP